MRIVRRETVRWLIVGVVSMALFVPGPNVPAQTADVGAIRDVTVISMTGALPIERATVVIRGGRISAVGPAADTVVPATAQVIDGTGKYLIPGLIEMHAHLSKARASALGLFVVHGVTTVRDMGGDHEELLRWRREIGSGARFGPRLLIAGPYLESASNVARMRKDPPEQRVEPFERTRIPIGSPDEAHKVIAELAARELDFLKIRTAQDEATYRAINAAADAHGLKLVGHVSAFQPAVVLDAGHDGIEHTFAPPADAAARDARRQIWTQMAARGVVIVPTLVALTQSVLRPIDHLRAMTQDDGERVEPRRRYVSKYLLLDWREQMLETTAARQEGFRKIWDGLVAELRDMHAAGMDVLAGSDVAVLNIFPGSSLHDDLQLFVDLLGFTPAEALDRATRRSARVLGIDNAVGTIERGKVADMVLLDANPLADIRHTRHIAAVISRGQVLDRAALDRALNGVATAPDIREDDWGRTRKR